VDDGEVAASRATRPGAMSVSGSINDLRDEEFQALYGPWRCLAPSAVRSLLQGCPFRWWIAGGWAIEVAGGASRHHEDTDVAVLKDDLAAVRRWLSAFHLWEAHDGALRPLLPGHDPTPEREQLWMRRDANGPWLLDLVFSPSEDADWIYKRDARIRLPLDEVGVVGTDGIPYLRPEVVVLFKAKHVRPKDQADFDSILPRLSRNAKAFLDAALRLTLPDHPWLQALDSAT
jgi:hypothetical protein